MVEAGRDGVKSTRCPKDAAPLRCTGCRPISHRNHLTLNLAILTSSLPPYPTGGAERQAAETARRLAARGHTVTVYARRMLPDLPTVVEEDGVRWVRCATWNVKGLSFPSHLASFAREWSAHGRGTDVVLAYQMVINGVLGLWAGRQGVPLVSWIRSQAEIRLGASRKFRYWTPRVLAGSQAVLMQTEALRTELLGELEQHLGSSGAAALWERIEILPNAIDPGTEPGAGERTGMVYLGRFYRVKGVDVLLDALARMQRPQPLTLIGDGPERKRLERMAVGLPVTFAGFVPREDLGPYLDAARVLVAPSRSEGFPNAILEGMARGLVPVASAVGGIPEVLGKDTGLAVPPEDPAMLAAALDRVFADPADLDRRARAARQRSLDFGWESHLESLSRILTRAASDAGRL